MLKASRKFVFGPLHEVCRSGSSRRRRRRPATSCRPAMTARNTAFTRSRATSGSSLPQRPGPDFGQHSPVRSCLSVIRFEHRDIGLYEGLAELTGIEREWSQFSRVQVGLSLCKHVQFVFADPEAGRYGFVWWSPRGRQTISTADASCVSRPWRPRRRRCAPTFSRQARTSAAGQADPHRGSGPDRSRPGRPGTLGGATQVRRPKSTE